MKERPWSKSPWHPWMITYLYIDNCSDETAKRNTQLAQLAPDMAEILIEFVEYMKNKVGIGSFGLGALHTISMKAENLLKGCGWEEFDESP